MIPTFALLVVMFDACVVVIPTLAVLAVIALACAEVIVVGKEATSPCPLI